MDVRQVEPAITLALSDAKPRKCYLHCSEGLVYVDNLANGVNTNVVVISRRESLLGCAVEHVTADEKEWLILRVSENHDFEELVQKVKQAGPDIVIISQDEPGYDEQLLARLNHDCPALKRVILVSLSENSMQVFSKQKIQVKSVEDLFSEVENQLSKLCPYVNQIDNPQRISTMKEAKGPK